MERSRRSRQGFTIIELVVVILVLGILAAVALPKFVDLRTQAHDAANQGTGGALAAAVNITHAAWLAQGGAGPTATLEGGTVVGVSSTGWPENDNAAAPDDTATAAECAALWNTVLSGGSPVAAAAAGPGVTYVAGVTGGTQCDFDYQPDGGGTRTITYDILSGDLTIAP